MKKTILYLSLLLISILVSSCEIGDVVAILADDSSTDSSTTDTSTTLDADASEIRKTIMEMAQDQLGVQYVYGGDSPSEGFDCSGLVYYCYTKNGITVPRTSSSQYASGTTVTSSKAQLSDIVAFYSPVSHVGLYINSTTFIHAPNSSSVVQEASLEGYWGEHLTGIVSYIDE